MHSDDEIVKLLHNVDHHVLLNHVNEGEQLGYSRFQVIDLFMSESTRLLPMLLGFDSQTRRHMWVAFVGSLLCTERFSPGTPVSPLLKNQHFT